MELRKVDNNEFDEAIKAGMGGFAIMGLEGDTKSIWNPRDADEVEVAKAQFKDLTAKGFSAFRVGEDGKKGTRMTEFDPEAGKVIMARPIVGG